MVQVGTPEQLFETPAHTFVGHFIGSPGMNFLPATVGAAMRRRSAECVRRRAADRRRRLRDRASRSACGPEYVELADAPATPNRVPVRVAAIQDLGTHTLVTARGRRAIGGAVTRLG